MKRRFKFFINPKYFLSIGCWIGFFVFLVGTPGWAAGESDFSVKMSEEAGVNQAPGGDLGFYQNPRILFQSRNDISQSLALDLAGEAQWQTSTLRLTPSWPVYPSENYLSLEADNLASSDGTNFQSLRLSRVFLKWISGRAEITAGLQNFNWGSSRFYQPTNYFFPPPPLSWVGDPSLGSEAMDGKCFLFDDLSLEAAARWLEGGRTEWATRLVNKGIGITVTPSFARLIGRDGLGLELTGTFPDFQVRFEGVDWLYPNGGGQVEWIAGISTVREGAAYSLEIFQDGAGNAMGGYSSGTFAGTYLFASMEKDFAGEWGISPACVKGLEGGPLLVWPKASWKFSPPWEMEFQGQIMIGNGSGPLALNQTRVGISIAYQI